MPAVIANVKDVIARSERRIDLGFILDRLQKRDCFAALAMTNVSNVMSFMANPLPPTRRK